MQQGGKKATWWNSLCKRRKYSLSEATPSLLSLLLAFVSMGALMCQEMTVPVGNEGRDTVTMIRSQDDLGNYDVGYNENLLTGGASFHRERGRADGSRQGSYGYTTRNGLIRIVTYVADQHGYRVTELLTNEPGVSTSHGNPSNVTVTKETEPDADALARGPMGDQLPIPTASGLNVPNVGPKSDYSGNAQVSVSAPYGQYRYFV